MSNPESPAAVPEMVTGLFKDRDSAERAFVQALDRGYDKSEINVVMDDDARKRYFPPDEENPTELSSKAAEHGELGGPKGGTLGTVFAAVAAVGTVLLLPGIGLALAGPVAVSLAGAGAAAVAGGLIGALHEWGISKERIDAYEAGLKAGGILVGVKPRSDADARYFEEQWRADDAAHVHA